MTLLMMKDEALDGLVYTETTGGAALPNLNDGDPSNVQTVGASLKVLVDLGDVLTPISCIGLFGISGGLFGGSVGVQFQVASPIGGDWGAGDYTVEIGSDRLWIPMDEPTIAAVYYRYWMLTVTAPAGGSGYLGEVAIGLAEQPRLNYAYGRTHGQAQEIIRRSSLGGVVWSSQINDTPKNNFELSWDGTVNPQDLANLRRMWKDAKGGLLPIVFIPDDNVRRGGCYYGYLGRNLQDAQEFFDMYSHSLSFIEAIAYEES